MNGKNKVQKKGRWFVAFICMLALFASQVPEKVKAGTVFTNAYMYYNVAGDVMVFIPGEDGQGEIYCATKAKKAIGSEILYTTLGWQVVVHDIYGTPVEVLYYTLGGENMGLVNSMIVDGYEYCLYKLSFANLKARLTPEAVRILNTANSFLTFNACTAVKIDGQVTGAMTDAGPLWGVYTTYDGIVNAQAWSEETKVTLHSYYNKFVSGLFYQVTANAGEGIAEVTGGGSYCYGAPVMLQAVPKEGYDFSHWEGSSNTTDPSISFIMSNEDVSYTAVGERKSLKVVYHGEHYGSAVSETREYVYRGREQRFADFGWQKAGWHQSGWNTQENAGGEQYAMHQTVSDAWILAHIPQTDLYATWEMNRYQIVYDTNGGKGELTPAEVKYADAFTTPDRGVTKECATLIGWSTTKDSITPEFACGESVSTETIVRAQELEYTNNGKITLYAIWDYAPEIMGEEIYISLEDARNGKVTPQWLAEFLEVTDQEDGAILYGKHAKNSFLATNFSATEFTIFQREGSVTEDFCAIDSVGNVTEKQIKVHIVDTSVYDMEDVVGKTRFISPSYYKKDGVFVEAAEGGLHKGSIWRNNDSYEELLDSLMELE